MYTVREIAEAIGVEAQGDLDLVIARAAEPQDAGPQDLAMATSAKYAGIPRGARTSLLRVGQPPGMIRVGAK